MMSFLSQLKDQLNCEILEDEPLSGHTSFGIGGPADVFLRPETKREVLTVLSLALRDQVPLLVIGRGTNLLVADGGVRGVVLDLGLACRRLQKRADGVVAGAGLSVQELLEFCARHELGGLEFLTGIPGSVGGAVRVNAGAWDHSVGEMVREVRGYDRSGEPVVLDAARMRFQYRSSSLPLEVIITEVELDLSSAPEEEIRQRMENFRQRRRRQPTDKKSAGSVFKNPPGQAAGKLIEDAGCKGLKSGGAEVSSKHANFIVNTGGAAAADVRRLIEMIKAKVQDQSGIELELEILLVGEQ